MNHFPFPFGRRSGQSRHSYARVRNPYAKPVLLIALDQMPGQAYDAPIAMTRILRYKHIDILKLRYCQFSFIYFDDCVINFHYYVIYQRVYN
jgi:hypothetical protein